jgi:hypothetical protein
MSIKIEWRSYEKWGVPVFANIAQSEQFHLDVFTYHYE